MLEKEETAVITVNIYFAFYSIFFLIKKIILLAKFIIF
jgi:hypothetical protein